MIIDHQRRVLVLDNPRTGTGTLLDIYVNAIGGPLDIDRKYIHLNRAQIQQVLTNYDLSNYTAYCLYRDPVERLVSCWKHFGQEFSFNAAAPNEEAPAEINFLTRAHEKFSAHVDARQVNLASFVTAITDRAIFPFWDLAAPQVNWLADSDVILPYAEYENSLSQVFDALGLIVPNKIPKINATDSKAAVGSLSQAQVAAIMGFYADDYNFFSAKGLVI